MDFGEGLKKVLFAGVGAVATTAETAKELIDTFAEKGEKTVAQSKIKNEELKRNVKEKINDRVTVHIVKEYGDVMKAIDSMTEEELTKLKEKIAKKEQQNSTKKETTPTVVNDNNDSDTEQETKEVESDIVSESNETVSNETSKEEVQASLDLSESKDTDKQ